MTSIPAPGHPEHSGNSSGTDQIWVHFAEQRGNLPALQQLALGWAAHPSFLGAEVLRSPAQASDEGELYLLVTRWQGAVPPLELPAGAKGWAFAALPQAARS
ncbi:MAG: hypothetical protein Q4C67_03805 [Deinococcus sp.]|nr:hypothetical protein [Deinococcus sp.]